ncbi:SDR family NAD(P)-dependent oxidoreductase [Rhizobium sp. CRIBSB]|nr:SDR family NAD(P)-dependent oxidoreductase [Rhizobium sp. CRIBSB]
MQDAAVIIGESGGIGAAMAQALRATNRFAVIHGFSRAAGTIDLEDEASIAAAAAKVAGGPAPGLIVVATGVLHSGQSPERTYRAMTPEHLLRDYRINTVGPAMVMKHFAPLLPRDRRAVFAALSARVGSISDNRLGGWHSYRASKAALNMLLRNLSIEMSRSHPQAVVAGLHPGTVETALSEPFRKGVVPQKLFTSAYSAVRLLEVLDSLTPADSGGVYAWDGLPVPA